MKRVSNHNYRLNERVDIISKTDNLAHIKQIIGPENILKEVDKFKFQNSNFNHINYLETEKFGILFFMKGGSSLIMHTLDLLKLTTTLSTRHSTWNKVFKSVMRIDNKDMESEEYPEFIKILNGKSKKDLIMVTRNPIYKWLSGVYQELEGEFERSQTLKYFLKQKYKGENIIEVLDDLTDDEFEEFCYVLLKTVFEDGHGTSWAHATLYNDVYYNFLELNPNIDKSKLKIIDIDSPNGDLLKLLSSYYPEVLSVPHSSAFKSHRLQHERILNSIEKRIIKGNEFALFNNIIKEIHNQHYYYLMLEHKYGKYFIQK